MTKFVSAILLLGVGVVLTMSCQPGEASPLNVGGNQWRIQSQDAGPCSIQSPRRSSGFGCMAYFDEWFYENGSCVQRGYSGCRSVGGFQLQSDCARTCGAQ